MHAFAGKDADIVHWEQTFNCQNEALPFELFIRQSLTLPNQPIVVISDSLTPNWEAKDCTDKKPIEPEESEKPLWHLIRDEPERLVTEVNKGDKEHIELFARQYKLFKQYKMAGIQSWSHRHFLRYKCHGPYSSSW